MKYCMAPYRGVYINNNKVRPCCWYDRTDLKNSPTKLVEAVDVFNSKEFDDIRQNQDNPKACMKCQLHEKNNGKSHRHIWNERHTDDNTSRLEMLDIYMGNLCNIACVMCSSNNSTKWISEEKKLFGKAFRGYQEDIDLDINYELVKDVKYIKLAGGEPLLEPKFSKFLQQLIDYNVSKNITLCIITNNTQDPRKFKTYFDKFKKVEFILSVDGFDIVNDYVRYGSYWNNVVKNIDKTIDMNIDVSINCVVSILNVYHLPKLDTWWNNKSDIFYRILDYPSFLSINNLTDYERQVTINELSKYDVFNHICHKLETETDYIQSSRDKFEKWISKVDNNRSVSFWDINKQFIKE